MEEEGRKICVVIPDLEGPLLVEDVPTPLTAGDLIDVLKQTLEVQNVDVKRGSFAIKEGNSVLGSHEEICSPYVELVICSHLGSAYVFLYYFLHVVSLLMLYNHYNILYTLVTFATSLVTLKLIAWVKSGAVYSFFAEHRPVGRIPIIEPIYLFFVSTLPTFRIESVMRN